MKNNPNCAVLLAAFNGEEWIQEQIQSICNQKDVNITLFISLDKSQDRTLKIIKSLMIKDNRIKLLDINKTFGSPSKNFYRLFLDTDFKNFDFIALSDQDDIWFDDKLIYAWQKLKDSKFDGFSSNVIAFWNEKKKRLIKKSNNLQEFDFFFEAAGPGCTYALKYNLADNFKKFLSKNIELIEKIDLHDWLIYAYSRYNNYNWHISNIPSMYYRQHSQNYIGAEKGFSAKIKRLKLIKDKWYRKEIIKIYRLITGEPDVKILNKLWLIKNFKKVRRNKFQGLILIFLSLVNLL